jgi:3-oxoadipate CoA-transferase alpha subunit
VIDKRWPSCTEALQDIGDGSRILISGFGEVGVPMDLVDALATSGRKGLTVIANNAGIGDGGIARLFKNDQVARLICSYPRSEDSSWFERRYKEGSVELELVPQGTLTERIRAGGAGIAGFYTRTGVGTRFAEGKESKQFDGETYLLEHSIRADFALVRAYKADRWGNAVYRKSARNYGPSMLTAADVSIVEVNEIVPLGAIDPEAVVTPGIYIDRLVLSGAPSQDLVRP